MLPELTVEGSDIVSPGIRSGAIGEIDAGISADGGDLLRSVTGVSGVRMGGHGIDPVIRGQKHNRLNILLDGAYVHGGCPNRMDPPTAYATTETYDRVTVIKGSQTVQYGGGGSGGTVLFERVTEPLQAGEKVRGRVSAGYEGNSHTDDLSADVTLGSTTAYVRLLASHKDAQNYQDGNGDEVRSAFEERGGGLIAGYRPDADTRVEIGFEATREDDALFPGSLMDSPQSDNDTLRLKVEKGGLGGIIEAVRAEIYRSRVDHVMDNYSLRTQTGTRMRTDADSDTDGARIVADILTAGGTGITIGFDYQKNDRLATRYNDTTRVDIGYMWPDVELKQTGVFAEMARDLDAANRYQAGLRYDRVSARAGLAAATPTTGVTANTLYTRYYGVNASDQDENNVGGFLRFEHDLENSPGTVFMGLSRTVRTADATERFVAKNTTSRTLTWTGNPRLDPEEHHQLDLGVRFAGAAWDFTGSLYYNDVDNYILQDRAHGQSGILQNDNATIYRNVDARFYGAELEAGWQPAANWQVGLGLAYVHATNTTDQRPIGQTPPLEGSLDVDYETAGWSAGATLRFADRQNRVEDNSATDSGVDAGKTPGWGVLNLHGEVSLTRNVDLKLGMDNVFDKVYANHLNKPVPDAASGVQVNEPGRAAWIRLSAAF